jgi:alcohol dehydrogenase class IV
MVSLDFSFARAPAIAFGAGKISELPEIIKRYGNRILVVTGSGSLKTAGILGNILGVFDKNGIQHTEVSCVGEPSPDFVDSVTGRFGAADFDVVLGIGGGSVIDAGKAISAMLPYSGRTVVDFLEGVGTGEAHSGEKLPFIAVPTTAGTGSEATKNAVLSRVGAGGFKKSLRHDNFVPDLALIDPELMLSCPADVTAACGMDAFTQLLESYLSTKASPMTDALAYSGLAALKDSLLPAFRNGRTDLAARTGMAYAALLSGITLANAGLGVVHGLASPIGGLFDIPHGVVCGTLVGAATKANMRVLMESEGPNHPALKKFANVGILMTGSIGVEVENSCELLVELIDDWTNKLNLPLLADYGIEEKDIDVIIEGTGIKNNPAKLSGEDIREILLMRL